MVQVKKSVLSSKMGKLNPIYEIYQAKPVFIHMYMYFLHTSFCVESIDPFDPIFAPPFLPAQRL